MTDKRRTITVSTKPPRILIRRHPLSIRVTVPRFNRSSVMLAHAIVAAFLAELSDEQADRLRIPMIGSGDRMGSCTIIAIDAVGVASPVAEETIRAASAAMHRAATFCTRAPDGTRTHDVTAEEAV